MLAEREVMREEKRGAGGGGRLDEVELEDNGCVGV